jgi:2-methylisocitrate lyase-like PEP mutase family enzyme
MDTMPDQKEKVKQFYNLHHSGKLLVLPNIWDILGAKLLQDLGYPAIATASASVAFTNGYDDGEKMPFDDVLKLLKKIADSVAIPVTADIESGFADNEIQLAQNVKQLLATGIAGINIEDTDKKTNLLMSSEVLCRKIQLIKQVAKETGTDIFINARADVYVRGKGFDTPALKLKETIERGNAYKSAGADCFFPLAVQQESDIKSIVDDLKMPVNIILIPGIPELKKLHEIGVARVSLGPGFLKIAINAMKNIAERLQNMEGLKDITENKVTSDYLKKLVNR